MQPFITLQNISVRKFEKIVFQHFNWDIHKGQHWAIVGPNGSGKTTLLEALAGKIPFMGGAATYHFLKDNEWIADSLELVTKDYSGNRILQSAAQYYQQRFYAYDSENSPTVWEFLADQMKPIGTIDDASVTLGPPKYTDNEINQAADILKISHLLSRKLMTLSNGETRRVLLTRSFLKQPQAILLDMPFVGLDVASRQILHSVLNHLAETGTTIIITTTSDEIPTCITDTLALSAIEDQETSSIQVNARIHALSQQTDTSFDYAVKMRNVTVSYNDKKVLHTIDWEVKRGEHWAVLGPNGSGKSTLLSLINADNPQGYANDIFLFDRKRGSGESIWDIKSRIGFVSPELHLYFPKQTKVYTAIVSGLFNTDGLYRTPTPEQELLIDDYIHLLNISHLSQKKLDELSTGEQREVLLARALVRNPPLLILDEPCQGLDTSRMRQFRDLINEICLQLNKTLLYVTHYEEEIPSCVTQILSLDAGHATITSR
ncbi:ATP-binding cassette domain-containing protein [Cytophagaceae bacterium YF14B1]|uniref:ATP-binding cassette domain-containing protein n=1 Tax=Xanthocytophaga flava TaxID=3048013 RepID=A0AAE3U6S4_9BACT|nr:ATP-binding cassette domain-containing protein [Xanthocytophaga flavus]MDJ1481621.1 ATP-binding cassette domain-containing protein [Xanthocytophaga flavus]